MQLTTLDVAIIALYFVLVVVVGVLQSKKAGRSLEHFFVANRQAPWWLAGAGMIATTFAADTPLVVTGLVATHGVAGNWLWWSMVMSGTLTVFLTARLWHRANVKSDVEICELRYGGPPAAALRAFRALFLALPVNLIVLGWVNKAMMKIVAVSLHVDPLTAMLVCFVVTVAYSAAGGLWAALWTDLVQLVLMMTAVIVLAVFAVDKVGGVDALLAGVAQHYGSERAAVAVWPPTSWSTTFDAASGAWMPALTLLTFLGVQWWAAWYPGAEPGGGGYVAQRIFSTRSERDGVLSVLFFNVGHYALRPWPWIVTALCAVLLYPGGVLVDGKPDVEASYIQAGIDLLPTGLRGFLLAGFFAAYMSTVSTHLNWGASYLISDVGKRFFWRDATDAQLVRRSRLATVLLFLLSAVVTMQLDTIESAWRFLIALGSGTGLVLILRWFWWRVSAWSEIAAMAASLVSSLLAWRFIDNPLGASDPGYGYAALVVQAKVLLWTVGASTAVWLAVTFATRPERDDVLRRFVERVRPGGPGWASVYARLSLPPPRARGREVLAGFLLGTALVYLSVFGIGAVVLGPRLVGVGLLIGAGACFFGIARLLPRILDDA